MKVRKNICTIMATIEELKKNGQTVYPVTVPEAVRDENGTNLAERLGEIEAEIPDVVDNVTSTAADDALSAKQGKLLNDRINNLQNIGRFLALWDCTTGLPLTSPSGYPYTYHTGDYFRVNAIGTTNYMPSGTSYQGVASTVVYSGNVAVNDVWFFDGTTWTLQVNHEGGTVQDVQLGGTSIVEDGVADIPTEDVTPMDIATSISNQSTDKQIPTAKATYDFVMGQLGNIETLLEAI